MLKLESFVRSLNGKTFQTDALLILNEIYLNKEKKLFKKKSF